MSVAKGDKCLLLDNSQKLKWRVRSAAGQEGMVPAVCFRIPPPDDEARAAVTRLRTELAEFKRRWSDRQRTLRYNMIFATIKVVRSWDLQQVNVPCRTHGSAKLFSGQITDSTYKTSCYLCLCTRACCCSEHVMYECILLHQICIV